MKTVSASSMLGHAITIPFSDLETVSQLKSVTVKKGWCIEGFHPVAVLSVTNSSEVWFCTNQEATARIIKFNKSNTNLPVIRKIARIQSDSLVPLLSYGYIENIFYEVYPFYRQGRLEEKLSEDKIRSTLIPCLVEALGKLHEAGIVHNDIKPQNLFWEESKNNIRLGDFGSAAFIGEKPASFTPAYAAYEILLGREGNIATDWMSVGLTLASVYCGKPLITGTAVRDVILEWEQGIHFHQGSAGFRQLVNGLLQIERKKRIGPRAAARWGGLKDHTLPSEDASTKVQREVIHFDNPQWVAVDIPGLLQGIEHHWDHAAFLFRERGMDRFLMQFDPDLGKVCKDLRASIREEDGLFKLTLYLSKGTSFIWRGIRCHSLQELELYYADDREMDAIDFVQRGHAFYYMQQKHAAQEQLEYMERLREYSRIHPREACRQMLAALQGDDGIKWEDQILNDIDDLVNYLEDHLDKLDGEIMSMLRSSRMEAWLSYMGLQGIVKRVKSRCEV